MIIEALFSRLEDHASLGYIALTKMDDNYTYQQLVELILNIRRELRTQHNNCRTIILKGNYSMFSIAMFWAALLEKKTVLPLSQTSVSLEEIVALSRADIIYEAESNQYSYTDFQEEHSKNFETPGNDNHPGVIILSSGSTGSPKAVLHDAEKLLKKYLSSKQRYSTMAIMLFDHIAGVDTMFYSLASGGTLVIPEDRNPEGIIKTAVTAKVEVMPASPSLIQLLLLDARFSPHSLPNLKIITFGSEYMTDSIKARLVDRFSGKVKIIQKYGVTEIGNPATITKEDDPSYIKFKHGLLEYKIVNGILMIKTDSSMLGYLFRDRFEAFDGWFNTQDKVEVEGEWLKILGRVSDIINVGGQKVYPAEVESVLQSMSNVKDAVVYGKANPLLGSVVSAKISLHNAEDLSVFKSRMRAYCRDKLDAYKIPAIIELVDDVLITCRHKKAR